MTEEQNIIRSSAVMTLGSHIRAVVEGATSLEDAGQRIVDLLHHTILNKTTGEPAFELVRFYKVLRYDDLEPDLKDFALAASTEPRSLVGSPCLALLGSAGARAEWRDRRMSQRHKAIPLQSAEMVDQMPMIAGLLEQLGVDVRGLIEPPPGDVVFSGQPGVFFVERALDSPLVPAQEGFVLPYGIESVVGVGGLLPDASAFAVVAFSSVPISRDAISAFGALGLSATLAVLPFSDGPVFEGDPPPDHDDERVRRIDRFRTGVLEELVRLAENAVVEQLRHLEDVSQVRTDEVGRAERIHDHDVSRQTAIVDNALDCIIEMDSSGRITGFNPAASRAFGYDRDEVLGSLVSERVIPPDQRQRHRVGLEEYLTTRIGRVVGRRMEIEAMRADGSLFPAELTVSVSGEDPPSFTGFLRDLSRQKAAERELLASRERIAQVARTLQTSLLPPTLPTIPGVSLAAVYRAAGEGNEVGGDFYDVYRLDSGTWVLALGDVCGKGPWAAALTALVRYTLRASLIAGTGAIATMDVLNRAIAQERPGDFCTLALIMLDAEDRSAEVLSAGHPPVLRITADRQIERIDSAGYFLGPLPAWRGRMATVELGVGDRLLLHSDGLTEARRDRDQFGEHAMDETLRTCAGADIGRLVGALEDAAVVFAGQLHDDLTMLGCEILGRDRLG